MKAEALPKLTYTLQLQPTHQPQLIIGFLLVLGEQVLSVLNIHKTCKKTALRLKAEALPKFLKFPISTPDKMAKIDFNFEKPTISKGILDFLSQNLVEDPDTNWDVVKKNLKESLAIIAKGNKLDYGSANNLLHSVLRALNLEDSSVEDEIAPAITQLADDFDSLSSQLPPATLTPTTGVNPKAEKAAPNQNQNKTKEICRFYTRGHCNRGGECRFEHPTICKKFRQFGNKSSDPKGCEGNCDTFHPNACRGSLFNRACSFKDCRFFHLKGTKMINRDQNNDSNQNWRSTQHTKDQGRSGSGSGSNQNRSKAESKNWPAGLNQPSKTRKKKKQTQSPIRNPLRMPKSNK